MMSHKRQSDLQGDLQTNVSLQSMNSWRVGGLADCIYRPAGLDDLAGYLSTLPMNEPLMWLGLGSNLLVRDGGIRGTVIATHAALNLLERKGEHSVHVQAGVPCAKVARFCARQGLTGAEFLAGIPGTMGGALAMNAGAFGSETWQRVAAVDVIDRRGAIHRFSPDDFEIGYRTVILPMQGWFVATELKLAPGDPGQSQANIRSLLARRGDTQPTGQPTCGSVFRNPPNDFAARLIESCGFKGHCIGGACVSEKHANFIINTGSASAADIETLIESIKTRIAAEYGVCLETEVRIVGEH